MAVLPLNDCGVLQNAWKSAWYSSSSCARRWVLYLVLWRKKVGHRVAIGIHSKTCGAWTANLTANVMTIELKLSWHE